MLRRHCLAGTIEDNCSTLAYVATVEWVDVLRLRGGEIVAEERQMG
ncbi:MAG: hypothetical protein WKF77_11705 [Planctomycetaceae bacterium]